MPNEEHVIAFDHYLYDLELGHLSRNGLKIRIPDQNARLLTCLIQKSGRLATRDELYAVLWPAGAPYDSAQAINKAISQLRTALRDDAANPRYIETIPQRGYRFCAQIHRSPVSTTSSEPLSAALPPQPAAPSQSTQAMASLPAMPSPAIVLDPRSIFSRRRWSVAVLLLFVVAALLAAGFVHRRHLLSPGASRPLTLGIALFEPDNPEAAELASALRMDLIAGLSSSPRTKVIASTSTKALKSDSTLTAAALKLGLDIVIFARISLNDDIFHLRLDLVHAADGSRLATLQYSGPTEQLMQTRTRIASDIFTELQLDRSDITNVGGTSNPLAYEAYLHGRYDYSKLTDVSVAGAVQDFKQAIQLDPKFGNAYTGLARAYLFIASRQDFVPGRQNIDAAQNAIDHALRISPAIAEAHVSQAAIFTTRDWNFSRALQEEQMAVQLKPGEANLHSALGWGYSLSGNYVAAYKEIALAHSLDPYNIAIDLNETYAVFGAYDCPRILALSSKFIKDAKDSTTALSPAARGLWACGQQEQAIATWRRIAILDHDPVWVAREDEGLKAWRKGGDKAYALTRLAAIRQDELQKRPSNLTYIPEEWDTIAGRDKEAMAVVEERVKEHDPSFLIDALNPNLARLRQQPEFQVLLHQVFK